MGRAASHEIVMANKMLIDAAHPEETRVVALRGNRVEDFDFESASKKPLRGNIYLAKVTRVEPSLQAAFIEYGGNRHGFLAFSEIHPDYYQIPVADRQALLEEEARAHREEDEDQRPSRGGGGGDNGNGRRSRRHRGGRNGHSSEKRADLGDPSLSEPIDHSGPSPILEDFGSADHDDISFNEAATESGESEPGLPFDSQPDVAFDEGDRAEASAAPDEGAESLEEKIEPEGPDSDLDEASTPDSESDASTSEVDDIGSDESEVDAVVARSAEPDEISQGEEGEVEEEHVEQLGGDAMEETSYRAPRLRRHYKIQEVIKRRQILLVQVVKEERGNKGAALTTYLSLAGRYSVLMPNTARGGGISRKITDADDRKRLKSIAQVLDVPEGMGVILRTAGAARGETEVTRDFEYLLRMWETVRELTLRSSAPMLVYEEGSLIKRAIRDLYSKEVDEVWVAGDAGFREAKDYMRLLMPTHAKNVHLYKDPQPIFAKAGAEAQLDAMFSNHVTLKSGGYIVINQTEALVAIDVNSGRSTREHNIEDTALRTNLEAADEVARQLRLRDLAGLIVVDFIDMEEGRNNRAVERRIKDALKNDRARIQIGRISHFGLLEMSRQRIRTGVLEGSTVICPHCAGAGTVRSTSSIALHVLRVLEDTLIRSASHNLIVRTRSEVALYVLNQKRAHLMELEQRFGVALAVLVDVTLTGTIYHAIERGELATPPTFFATHATAAASEETEAEDDLVDDAIDEEDAEAIEAASPLSREDTSPRPGGETAEQAGDRKRKRRRRRRGRDRDGRPLEAGGETSELSNDLPDEEGPEEPQGETEAAEGDLVDTSEAIQAPQEEVALTLADEDETVSEAGEAPPEAVEQRRRRRTRRPANRVSAAPAAEEQAAKAEIAEVSGVVEEPVSAPRRSRRSRSRVAEETTTLLAFEAPSADRDVGADTAKNHPADVTPDSDAESTQGRALAELELPTSPAEAEKERSAEAMATPSQPDPLPQVETPAEELPPRPKRSGWWQRAKATLTGE